MPSKTRQAHAPLPVHDAATDAPDAGWVAAMELLHERYQHFRVHPVRRAANDELDVPP